MASADSELAGRVRPATARVGLGVFVGPPPVVKLGGSLFFFSSRRRHTRSKRDWSSDVCSSDLRVGGSGSTITDGVRVITGGTESLLLRARDQTELTESSSRAVENVRGGISGVLAEIGRASCRERVQGRGVGVAVKEK